MRRVWEVRVSGGGVQVLTSDSGMVEIGVRMLGGPTLWHRSVVLTAEEANQLRRALEAAVMGLTKGDA